MAERDWPNDVRVGDVIRSLNPRHRHGRVAREVVAIDGDYILTVGKSGSQRDRWASRANLRRYELVTSGPTREEG